MIALQFTAKVAFGVALLILALYLWTKPGNPG